MATETIALVNAVKDLRRAVEELNRILTRTYNLNLQTHYQISKKVKDPDVDSG